MMRFILRSLLFSAVGTAAYLLVFYVTFPADDLKARIMTEARKASVDLRIGDIRPHGLSGMGLKFDGVSVGTLDVPKRKRRRGKAAQEEDAAEEAQAPVDSGKPPLVNLDEVIVDVALLPLLRGKADRVISLDVDAEGYGGEITGALELGPKRRKIDLEGNGIEVARYPIQGEDFKIDAVGLLAFNTDLDLSVEDVKASTGSFTLDIQGLRVLKSSLVSQMPLPVELMFTEAVMRLAVAEGKADVEALRLMGDAISVEGDGEIFLSDDLGRSRLKMSIRIRPGEDLQILTAVLPSRAKSTDGYYHYMVTGTLLSPRFRPDAGGARTWSKDHGGAATAARSLPEPDIGMDDEGDEDEPEIGGIDQRRVSRPPAVNRPGAIDKNSLSRPTITDEDRDNRREERRRLAEERRQRREERLKKIREAQELSGESFQDRGREIIPPFPGDADAPFRPGMGRRDLPPPPGVDDVEEEFIEEGEDDHFVPQENFHEDEMPEPDVEIIQDGDFEEPPRPGERFEELPEDGNFEEPMDDELPEE